MRKKRIGRGSSGRRLSVSRDFLGNRGEDAMRRVALARDKLPSVGGSGWGSTSASRLVGSRGIAASATRWYGTKRSCALVELETVGYAVVIALEDARVSGIVS